MKRSNFQVFATYKQVSYVYVCVYMYMYLFTCTQRVGKSYGQKDSKGGRQSVKISVGLPYNFN